MSPPRIIIRAYGGEAPGYITRAYGGEAPGYITRTYGGEAPELTAAFATSPLYSKTMKSQQHERAYVNAIFSNIHEK